MNPIAMLFEEMSQHPTDGTPVGQSLVLNFVNLSLSFSNHGYHVFEWLVDIDAHPDKVEIPCEIMGLSFNMQNFTHLGC